MSFPYMVFLFTLILAVQGVGGKAGIGGKAGFGGGAVASGCTASVTVDTSGSITQSTGTNLSSTVGGPSSTDANTLLVAKIMFDGASASVSGCTWNSVSLTSAGTAAHDATNNLNASFWYLLNPSSGSQTLACTGTSVNEYYYGDYVFKNVNATTPIRAGTYQTTTTNQLVMSSNSQDWSITENESSGSTPTTNQTPAGSSGAGSFAAAADQATTPASSVTHTWTASGTHAVAGMSVHCK